MTVALKGLGKPKKKDRQNLCSVSDIDIDLSQSASVNALRQFSANELVRFWQFACVSKVQAAATNTFSVCVSHDIVLEQVADLEALLELAASDTLQLLQFACVSKSEAGAGGKSLCSLDILQSDDTASVSKVIGRSAESTQSFLQSAAYTLTARNVSVVGFQKIDTDHEATVNKSLQVSATSALNLLQFANLSTSCGRSLCSISILQPEDVASLTKVANRSAGSALSLLQSASVSIDVERFVSVCSLSNIQVDGVASVNKVIDRSATSDLNLRQCVGSDLSGNISVIGYQPIDLGHEATVDKSLQTSASSDLKLLGFAHYSISSPTSDGFCMLTNLQPYDLASLIRVVDRSASSDLSIRDCVSRDGKGTTSVLGFDQINIDQDADFDKVASVSAESEITFLQSANVSIDVERFIAVHGFDILKLYDVAAVNKVLELDAESYIRFLQCVAVDIPGILSLTAFNQIDTDQTASFNKVAELNAESNLHLLQFGTVNVAPRLSLIAFNLLNLDQSIDVDALRQFSASSELNFLQCVGSDVSGRQSILSIIHPLPIEQTAHLDASLQFDAHSPIDLKQFPASDVAGPPPDIHSLLCVNDIDLDQDIDGDPSRAFAANSDLNIVQIPNADLFGLGSGGGSSPGVEDSFSDKGIVNRNVSRRINQTLYSLKRLWGGSFSIYSVGDATVDHLDGTQDEPATVIHVKRGIILPGKHIRGIKHTLSMITANKAFVTGGTYDQTARTFIVDRVDAPNLDLTESDYIVYDNKRYEVKEFQEYEFDSAWVIAGQAIEGENPVQIRLLAADDLLRLDQSVIEVP